MKCIRYAVFCAILPVFVMLAFSPLVIAPVAASEITKVVLLGTGTPAPDPARAGPSIAIVVKDTPYIVDFGPGVVRRAAAFSPRFGGSMKAFSSRNLKVAFLTHLHSDHTVGYADLILTPWVVGRDEPLHVYGPEGLADMTEHILKAYQKDIDYRIYGLERGNNRGWRVDVHEIGEGVVYEDDNVKVEAFRVKHGSWPNAFGYRFTTPDRTIVISGDTAPSQAVETYARGADILIHEVYSLKGYRVSDAAWQRYLRANHTSTHEVGELAARAKPKLLILSHVLFWGASPEEVLAEVAEKYAGKVVVGSDLDIY